MIPRTRLDFRILDIRKLLEPLECEVRNWAIKHCLPNKGIQSSKSTYCFNCNRVFPSNNIIGSNNCPFCSAKLTIEKSKRKKYEQIEYFSVVDLQEDFQIVRHFLIRRKIHVANLENTCDIFEVAQNYHNVDTGEKKTIARPLLTGYSYRIIPFNLSAEMRLTKSNFEMHFIRGYVYPKGKIHKYYKKRGVKSNLHDIQPDHLFLELRYGSQVETMLKAKMHRLLDQYITHPYVFSRRWAQIKIAIRHKYNIKDPAMWMDHIEMLERNSKDIHNPKFILPVNLRQEHQYLIEVDRRRRNNEQIRIDKRRALQEAKEAEEALKMYVESKGKFFGFHVEKNGLEISVIKSITEMAEEGCAMNHCVYASRYYARNCLILSCKDAKDRIATIELSLEDFRISQIRGKCNSQVPEEPIIREMIISNLNKLIKLNNAS